MIKNRDGFSLVELLITMAIFTFVVAAATGIFVPLMSQFKQQSKIAETNVEGIVGLEIMRVDIEHAGTGLPQSFQNALGFTYLEAASAPASAYNDTPTPGTTSYIPRPVVGGNNLPLPILNNSDYLVIKSTLAATNSVSQKWTYITMQNTGLPLLKSWPPNAADPVNFQGNEGVIVIKTQGTDYKQLIMNGGTFYAQYNSPTFDPNFTPTNTNDTYIIYGIDPVTPLRMPFNRADYYIQRPANMPQRCAPGTGILYKATVNQSDGKLTTLPLLDCVADMQVIFGLDVNNNARIDTYTTPDGTFVPYPIGNPDYTAAQSAINSALVDPSLLRQQLAEVRVYILAHEGQRDPSFTYQSQTVTVGDFGLGSTFDLKARIGDPEYKYYRWKIYTMAVKPANLK